MSLLFCLCVFVILFQCSSQKNVIELGGAEDMKWPI